MDDDEADGKQSSTGGGASTSSTAAGEGKNKKREGQRISNQGRSAHGARESAQGENNEDDTVDDDDDDDDDEKKEKEPEADEYTKLVLSMLTQRGVQALKVGRNGPARKTRVTLSADGWYLCWKSRVKRRKLARVKLDQVTRIMR